MTTNDRRSRWWFSVGQVTNQYLKQWWPCSYTHKWVTALQWVNVSKTQWSYCVIKWNALQINYHFICSCASDIAERYESWWRHQMETFSALLALFAGNSPVPVNSPHKGQWRGALMFSFVCAWINDWVNNREAGDLRCHRGHYDVNVMIQTRY